MNGRAVIPPASAEQLAIVENLGRGFNIIVNSVAGSGKTTTSLHVAKGNSYLRPHTLLLTYNARLKDETRMKAKELGLHTNLEVHSFHAFGILDIVKFAKPYIMGLGVKYYSPFCFRDAGIRATVENDGKPSDQFTNYDIIIIDESQDMTNLYYSFVSKILRDHKEMYKCIPQMLIIGDEHQCIFAFNGSDSRFVFH